MIYAAGFLNFFPVSGYYSPSLTTLFCR